MKIRNLLITLGFASGAVLGWYAMNDDGQEAPAYTPRSDYNEVATGAKGHIEYLNSVRANIYTGEVEMEDILNVQKAIEKVRLPQAKNDDIEWASIGPDNVGGRTRAILPLSADGNVLIAGGVSGGLYITNDGAQNWSPLTNFDPYLIVSSLARLGNGAIYAATGHSREGSGGSGGSGFIGRGLFVSNDDGQTWDLVSDFQPEPYDPSSNWAETDVIKADPVDPNKLWVGTNFGLYPFTHGDTELGDTPNGLFSAGLVRDLDISSDGQTMLAMIGTRLFRSQDGGDNWVRINESNGDSGFPTSGFASTELCISQNDPNYMYVSLAQPSGFLRGIYASADGGDTWNVIAPQSNSGGVISQFAPFYNGLTAQGWYDNMITSVPGDNEEVIMGGIRMWRWNLVGTTPGITAWEEVNANFASFPGGPPSPIYVHSDIHTDAWDESGNLWIGSDGGIFRSNTQGATWTHLNKGYKTTQYYAIAFNPFGQVLGGLQDNGTLWSAFEGSNPQAAVRFTGGDGFDCEISQKFPDYMFSTIYNGALFRSTDGGDNIFPMDDLFLVSGGGGDDFTTDIALHEHPNNEFSEVVVEYSPALDSPWLEFYDEPIVTEAGDTIIARIPAGSDILVDADNNDYALPYSPSQDVNFYSYFQRVFEDETQIFEDVADTVFVQEKPQFLLAAALSNGVYVTRQPLKTNGVPQFYQVDEGESSNPSSVEWSPDGDHLYVGYGNGRLIRLSGFNSAWTEEELTFDEDEFALTRTVIQQGGGAVTDIEVDYSLGQGPDASERVLISQGGYGGASKVRVSESAATAAGIGSFDNIWNVPAEFTGMPVYSVVMDIVNPSIILAGTEYGVWYSGDNGETWSEANNGEMPRVPVFDLRQQKEDPWNVENSGVVYAGSHGRGLFRTEFFLTPTDIDEIADAGPVFDQLKVFPNPVSGEARVTFDLGTSADIEMFIYSTDGRLVKAFQEQRVESGFERQIAFDASDLSIGQYIIQLRVADTWQTGKFVVTR